MIDANRLVGTHDVLLVTLDSLRHDVAQAAWQRGLTPELARRLPTAGWEPRHSPGNFTYPAHLAFFAGFLPTPARPGPHPRLFAVRFPGSESVTAETCVFEQADIVAGFAARGYHTVCIGGVGFFNRCSPLGCVLPGLFAESFWTESFGVTCAESTRHQVDQAEAVVGGLPGGRRLFLFLNVSATHQPSRIFQTGAERDSPATQAAALAYADAHLGRLFRAMARRAPVLAIVCSDHGTAYGEDGYEGHRLCHPAVWTVPYAEFILSQSL